MLTNYRKTKLFLMLRRVRHELFDEPFQRELLAMYPPVSRGKPRVATGDIGDGDTAASRAGSFG